jgi:hypothetical protein
MSNVEAGRATMGDIRRTAVRAGRPVTIEEVAK